MVCFVLSIFYHGCDLYSMLFILEEGEEHDWIFGADQMEDEEEGT